MHAADVAGSIAHNTAMQTLDFVSLFLSKETPIQAGLTLSPALRELVGIGTLGSTPVNASNVTEAKERDNHSVAVGWTFGDIEKTREAAERARAALQKEAELEERYWGDIMDATEHGWSVCRLPQARNVLGVRYGFSEGWCLRSI